MAFTQLSPAEIEALADKVIGEKVTGGSLPGAVFLVVRDSQIVFARGYGYANMAQKTPLSPLDTVLPVASVSKLFTATAALQLVENGLLDLHADVNSYLSDFQLKTPLGTVTPHHLLTHTAGFDERLIGVAVRDKSAAIPLGEYIASRMPPPVFSPGKVMFYSNHGITLLGYLIEVLSGLRFHEYVRKNLLHPLGMHNSSFDLPDPPPADHATGYIRRGAALQPLKPDFGHLIPAGGLRTTAAEMAKFIIAHLNAGAHGQTSILQPATLELMHAQQFSTHAHMPGVAYGFFESFHFGQRALSHDGAGPGISSALYLLPEHKEGFFFATNINYDYMTTLIPSRYLAKATANTRKALPVRQGQSPKSYRSYAGKYRTNRYARRTLEKLMSLRVERTLALTPTGELALKSKRGSHTVVKEGQETPTLFQSPQTNTRIAFRLDAKQRVTHMLISQIGATRWYERISWFQRADFHKWLAIVLVAGLLLVTALAFLPLGLDPSARWLASLSGALNLAFILALGLTLRRVLNDYWEFGYGLPLKLRLLLLIPLATALLALAMLGLAIDAWVNSQWSLTARLYYTFATLVNGGFTIFLHYWNLLGIRA